MDYFLNQDNLYEVLGVADTASLEDIEGAYLQVLSEIETDSLALYSIVEQEQIESRRQSVHFAYRVLSDAGERANYDQKRQVDRNYYPPLVLDVPSRDEGTSTMDPLLLSQSERSSVSGSTVKFPAKTREEVTDGLVRETRDLSEASSAFVKQPSVPPAPPEVKKPIVTREVSSSRTSDSVEKGQDRATARLRPSPRPTRPTLQASVPQELMAELNDETVFDGRLLLRLRESCSMSLKDVEAVIKVSRHYLKAIERDAYDELPARVYVRGFVTQYARLLGLDGARVSASYLECMDKQERKK